MELGQLGQKDAEQGGRVDDEVRRVVFGVEAGEEVPGQGERETPGELSVAPTLAAAGTGGGISYASLAFPAQNSTSQLGNPPLQPLGPSPPGQLC